MKKLLPILILLSIAFIIGCQERGQPARFSYHFWIKDSTGINLVGDSIDLNRYFVDSVIYFNINGNIVDSNRNELLATKDFYKGYYFGAGISTNTDRSYVLKYNSIEKDTLRVVYGKDNINVFQNNQLIFSKYNLSQVPPVEFNIIK